MMSGLVKQGSAWLGATAIAFCFVTAAHADDSNQKNKSDKNKGHSKADNKQSSQQKDPELKLQYDDDKKRFTVDVDEDFRLGDQKNSNKDEAWTRDGEFNVQYDQDTNRISGDVGGTIRLDEIGNDIANWWKSYWKEDKDSRGNNEQGAAEFIRRHDRDDDGRISRRELPKRVRDEFSYIDRNEDDELSETEIRRYGDELFEEQSQQAGRGRTWSQWWAQWWYQDHPGSWSGREIFQQGVSKFIALNDRNGDDVLVRTEMPRSMYDEFEKMDDNGDRELTRPEIAAFAAQTRRSAFQSGSEQGSRQQQAQKSSSPRDLAFGWLLRGTDSEGDAGRLQQAYQLMSSVDANNDGKLSKKELRNHRDKIVKAWVNRMFDKYDENSNDLLDRNEVSGQRISRDFSKLDQNDNDKLSRDELLHAAMGQPNSNASRSANGN